MRSSCPPPLPLSAQCPDPSPRLSVNGSARCNVADRIVEGSNGTFHFDSPGAGTGDPWKHATGHFLPRNATTVRPARCLGGMVDPKEGGFDVEMDFHCLEPPGKTIVHSGTFDPTCNILAMDDGGAYARFGANDAAAAAAPDPEAEDGGCENVLLRKVTHPKKNEKKTPSGSSEAVLVWTAGPKAGWRTTHVAYEVMKELRLDVDIHVDPSTTVVRMNSTITALRALDRCVGGIALLRLSLNHTEPTVLYGSTGGYTPATTALQPWSCDISTAAASNGNNSCDHVAGTPFRPHEDWQTTPLVASADSGLDGRSSNFQLAIHSVAMGEVASTTHGVWMAPEYSGLWRADTWAVPGGSRFYWSLPSLLFAMTEGQSVPLPTAAFGEWNADGGQVDWSNAVRAAISTHFTPAANRGTGARPTAKAVYQGLGALPSYQTEEVLYQTVANAKRLGLEQWTWDAGTYTWCHASSVCNGTDVVLGRCCDEQGDWFAQQGDYMPKDTRFPEHGFMALQRKIGEAVGSNAGRANQGVWLTPQASYLSQTWQHNQGLYLSGATTTDPGHHAGSTNNLLNLIDPRAQDLFFAQFEELIRRFNCSRVWFDYNTQARQTHWNQHEAEDGQGLLELGFYRGLYAVFDRTLAEYPSIWIEGCASGGRMIDLGSLSRTMSHWINDDSVSDDRNRRLRLGANHFIPAHYLQNAFLPVGTGALPLGVLEPVVGPLSIDPQRLLTYFTGVMQFGQGARLCGARDTRVHVPRLLRSAYDIV